MTTFVHELKITGVQWAEWAGVGHRTAQRWLSGERPAPAWAVSIAVDKLATTPEDRQRVALALLDVLDRRYYGRGS